MSDQSPDFDRRARVYDTLRPTDDAWWQRFETMVDLAGLRGQRILDVGCGTGRFAAALATEARARVWAIDDSREMVAVARETVPTQVGVRRGKAERLPFRDGWFDRVTMSLVVHLLDRPAAFAEAQRVLARGGRIAIATFALEHFDSYWLNPYFPSIRAIDLNRFPSPAQLHEELSDAGFDEVVTEQVSSVETISRETALSRIKGRHISTFDLLPADEVASGTAQAEAELPAQVETRLEQLVVVGTSRG